MGLNIHICTSLRATEQPARPRGVRKSDRWNFLDPRYVGNALRGYPSCASGRFLLAMCAATATP